MSIKASVIYKLEKAPLITVMMSCYNENIIELEDAIRSVQNQTLDNVEIVVVNDNPQNAELSNAIKRASSEDKRIKYWIHTVNIGLARTMNEIALRSNADYLARMDADDISLPNRLELEYKRIIEHNADVVYSDALLINESGAMIGNVSSIPNKRLKYVLPYGNAIIHPTVLMKKSSFIKAGGYRDFPCSQDYDLWLRMMSMGVKFLHISEYLLKYRIRSSSITISKSYQQMVTAWYISERYLERRKRGKDMYTIEHYQEYLNKYMGNNNLPIEKWRLSEDFLRKAKEELAHNNIIFCVFFLLTSVIKSPIMIRRLGKSLMFRLGKWCKYGGGDFNAS